jgi:two-component system response regulator CpxR
MKLLMIDDDRELTELLGDLLSLEGFDFQTCHDGDSGLKRLTQESFDMVLLDVMMPGKNGFDVLKLLRRDFEDLPVLMLTAKGDEFDRVLGLELGADDYLPKPFSDRELLARIKAILRRSQKTHTESTGDESITHDDIELFPKRQQAKCGDQILDLTSTEFLLFEQFIRSPGEILEKGALNLTVLGKKLMPFDRSLDMHVSNLRKKIPERSDGNPRIKTVRGKGYLWLQW